MANDSSLRGVFRELACGATDGLEVALLWSELEDRLAVEISDTRSGQRAVLDAEDDYTLDIFHHPHAALQAAA